MVYRKKRKTNISSSNKTNNSNETSSRSNSEKTTTTSNIKTDSSAPVTSTNNLEDDQEVRRRIFDYLPTAITYRTLLSKQEDNSTKKSSSNSLIPQDTVWNNPIAEIVLFETIEQFPPLGEHLSFSLINIFTALQRHDLPNMPSIESIHNHLLSLYNLDRLKEDADFKWDRQEFELPKEIIDEVGDQVETETSKIGQKRSKKTSGQKGSRKRKRKS
eukprot:gb/GECH01008405.1/.p1 GENE.gb/GECH01008405.1/~~gb/GECH01008405.1/.p1  ORF type:complete len:216 (+),score=71.50 gb/GECH01008405.1/:1-648(+)